MKRLLENIEKSYQKMEKFQRQQSVMNSQRMLSMQYAMSDASMSDDDRLDTERSNQTMINIPQPIEEDHRQKDSYEPLIEADRKKDKSCWASIFYCGGDNDNEIRGDVD